MFGKYAIYRGFLEFFFYNPKQWFPRLITQFSTREN